MDNYLKGIARHSCVQVQRIGQKEKGPNSMSGVGDQPWLKQSYRS